MVPLVREQLQQRVRQRCRAHWKTGGWVVFAADGTEVWLWPQDRQHKPPLVLRLLRFGHGKQVVSLVTDVHDPRSLPTTQAEQLYRQRWGIEVTSRTIKQTLDRSHRLSRTPQTGRTEHAATILAVWILQVLSVEEIVDPSAGPSSLVGGGLTGHHPPSAPSGA
jgi:hypothetical protein